MAANAAPPVAAAPTQAPARTTGAVAEEAPKVVEQPAEKPEGGEDTKTSKSKSRRDRRRDGAPKKKKKKPVKDEPRCVGYYLDALDKKMLWAEAKIIGCDVPKQKLRVHFIGWGKCHDIWTDTVSIAAHGKYAGKTNKNGRSWDGDMRLFEDLLGVIDESTPCHDRELANKLMNAPANVAPPPPPKPVQRRVIKAKSPSVQDATLVKADKPSEKPSGSRDRSKTAKSSISAKPASRPRPVKVSDTAVAVSKKRTSPSAATAVTPPSGKRRVSNLPEIASVQVVKSESESALNELEERKRRFASELEQSIGFMETCAGILKHQLAELVAP